MDWPLAIERHRVALLGIVASIVALVGGRDAEGPIALGLRRAALALLRPAESAARRLIVIAARGLSVTLRPKQPAPAGVSRSGPARRRAFRLFDPPLRFRRGRHLPPPRGLPLGVPRIRSFGASPFPSLPPPPPPTAPRAARPDPDAPVAAEDVRLRLAALEFALADLPRQARRLARTRARRAARPGGFVPSPLRPGRPPGHRPRLKRDIDHVLQECHGLARDALRADTS